MLLRLINCAGQRKGDNGLKMLIVHIQYMLVASQRCKKVLVVLFLLQMGTFILNCTRLLMFKISSARFTQKVLLKLFLYFPHPCRESCFKLRNFLIILRHLSSSFKSRPFFIPGPEILSLRKTKPPSSSFNIIQSEASDGPEGSSCFLISLAVFFSLCLSHFLILSVLLSRSLFVFFHSLSLSLSLFF